MRRISRRPTRFATLTCVACLTIFGAGDIASKATRSATSSAVLSERSPDREPAVALAESYGRLPLSFEANEGQAGEEFDFLSRGSGYSLFLDSTQAVLSLRRVLST